MKTKLLLLMLLITSFGFSQQIPSGFVAKYDFNNNLDDEVANADFTTGLNTITYVDDRFTNLQSALQVDNTAYDGYVFPAGTSEFSISFWVFLEPGAGNQRILQAYDTSTDGFRIEYNGSNNSLFCQYRNNSTSNNGSATVNLDDGAWHHIVLTSTAFFQSSGTQNGYSNNIYIDGGLNIPISQNIFNGFSEDIFTTATTFRLSPLGGVGSYGGDIDDILIYDRGLTQQEVSDIYNFTPPRTVAYVNGNVSSSGANDGSSWADAYDNLNTALSNSSANTDIWVAKGTYTQPSSSGRSASVDILNEATHIYGGFDGTEVNLSDRDLSLIHTTNATTLSGDSDGDDDNNVSYDNLTRDDNSFRVVSVQSNNVLLDGLIISGGYADAGAGQDRFGAAVGVVDNLGISNFTISNTVLKDNVAFWAAGISIDSNALINITIDACRFENNLAVLASSYYALSPPISTGTSIFNLTNSLFVNNRTADDATKSRVAIGAPAGWVRAFNGNSNQRVNIINNTFVNNVSEGTSTDSEYGTLGISEFTGDIFWGSSVIANNIFWDNTTNNGALAKSIVEVLDNDADFTAAAISNNIDEDGFSNISVGTTNTSTTNPNLTSSFNLQQSSTSAIDTGDNSKVPTGITTDLAGNDRFFNTTVDRGAYEFDPSNALSLQIFDEIETVKLFPNPVKSILNIESQSDIKSTKIFSILGKQILTTTQNAINVSELKKGIYLITVEDFEGNSSTLKFIKN